MQRKTLLGNLSLIFILHTIMSDKYYRKYLQYKFKYLQLKKQLAGAEHLYGDYENYVISSHGEIISNNLPLNSNILIITYKNLGCSIDNDIAHQHMNDIMKENLTDVIAGNISTIPVGPNNFSSLTKEIPRVYGTVFPECLLSEDTKFKTNKSHFASGVYINDGTGTKRKIINITGDKIKLSEIINQITQFHLENFPEKNKKIFIHCLFCLDAERNLSTYRSNPELLTRPFNLSDPFVLDYKLTHSYDKATAEVLMNEIDELESQIYDAELTYDVKLAEKLNKQYQTKCKKLEKIDSDFCINCDACYNCNACNKH